MIGWTAVLLSLALPCLYVILHRAVVSMLGPDPDHDAPLFHPRMKVYFRVPTDEENPLKTIASIWNIAASLAPGGVRLPLNEANDANHVNDASDVNDISDVVADTWQTIYNFHLRQAWNAGKTIFQSWRLFGAFIVPVLFFLVLYFGGIIATILFADMAKGSVIVSASSRAGNWVMNQLSPNFLLGDGYRISEDLQRRTWAYKEACYGEVQPLSNCDTFYKPHIPSVSQKDVSCPFYNRDVCYHGKKGAYQRSTGLLDSNVLGINIDATKRFHFSKTMVCSPLRVDNGYVVATGDPEYPNEYLYNYGRLVVGEELFDNYAYRNPMEWKLDFEDYSAFTLS
jgi:hypothetical protein